MCFRNPIHWKSPIGNRELQVCLLSRNSKFVQEFGGFLSFIKLVRISKTSRLIALDVTVFVHILFEVCVNQYC